MEDGSSRSGQLAPAPLTPAQAGAHHPRPGDPLVVPARFNGPPGSANGGYLAGRLAAYLEAPAVQVTLRQPPPLDAAMDVVVTEDGVRATFGGALVAEAALSALDVDPIDPVSFAMAAELAGTYAGLQNHPFPTCFVCGSDRDVPDGLALRPGRLADRPDTTASAWRPDASLVPDGSSTVPAEMVWAALDCPGGWAVDLVGRPAVLGRMTAQVDALPEVGDACVVMGRVLGQEGRKSFSASTLYDGDGRVLGRAHAVWIEVDPTRIGRS